MNLTKLLMTDYKVEMINGGMQEFFVQFHKPKHSPYQEGVWKKRVELPDIYPYKSPSMGFVIKVYNPNVDEILSELSFGGSPRSRQASRLVEC